MARVTKAEKLLTDPDRIKNAALEFITKEANGYESRYKTWAYCHDFFKKLYAKNKGKEFSSLDENTKQLALLNLSFYLASWGMYRGSSFVLQYDNTIFENIITAILKTKYNDLWDLSYQKITTNKERFSRLLIEFRNEVSDALIGYRDFTTNKSVFDCDSKTNTKGSSKKNRFISQTLTTKILLGTVCCCPAYDKYFRDSVGASLGDFNSDEKVRKFFDHILQSGVYKELSEDERTKGYPLMKLVDMAHFRLGIESEFEKVYNKYIIAWSKNNKLIINDKNLLMIARLIKQFYYKSDPKSKPMIHVGFKADKKLIDEFMAVYGAKMRALLLKTKNVGDDEDE